MRDLLEGKGRHYRVYTNAPEGAQASSTTSLEDFADMLPHGSGLDTNWLVDVRRYGHGLTLRTEWHAMNESGYTGWHPVRIVLDRDASGLGLTLRSVRINERATNQAGDHIADCISDVLSRMRPVDGQGNPK